MRTTSQVVARDVVRVVVAVVVNFKWKPQQQSHKKDDNNNNNEKDKN